MMQYKIVAAPFASDLEREVLWSIEKGWELSGGVSVAVNSAFGGSVIFAQAMIKRSVCGN